MNVDLMMKIKIFYFYSTQKKQVIGLMGLSYDVGNSFVFPFLDKKKNTFKFINVWRTLKNRK